MINALVQINLILVSELLYVIPLLALTSLVYLYKKGYKNETLVLGLSFLSYPIILLVKLFFKAERPPSASKNFLIKPQMYSFPSAHTTFWVIFWGILLYFALTLKKLPKVLRSLVIIGSVYSISLIGFSRVYLGEHYIRDVVAGYLLGGTILVVLILIQKRLKS